MASNIEYDPELLKEAVELGGFRYKKDAVNAALEEFVRRRRQLEVVELFGSIDFDPNYDYKKNRKKR